ncbi:DUF4123 domain-containing protein [Pseudomonas sp. sp1636]|uniref:DUF4123 domain-containing protein n=1 Tax=Pseudomonas sp. sp1636 TaxID=3036707 RepID=UPI0025A55A77|nr:DUF4123 domain-containing protein [Pseudomonas sp. sp1636]MDM8348548.1 DUF4123 domain-containing protein [Pseudomonas sp. sp1636]
MIEIAQSWLADQLAQQRELVLVIDRLAKPDPIKALFSADLMQDYVNLYQGTEFADLADVGPWLVRLTDTDATFLHSLLEAPQQNWGWLASAEHIDLAALAEHWRARMLIDEEGQRSLYRFQDPRVIARSLAHLAAHEIPQLLGPLNSVLCWESNAWHSHENPQPGPSPFSQPAPWLYSEPASIAREIRLDNLEQWLWENQPEATSTLAKQHEIRAWLDDRLKLAERWGWTTAEQLFLLLNQKRGALELHPAWEPQPNESPDTHFVRCHSTFSALISMETQA